MKHEINIEIHTKTKDKLLTKTSLTGMTCTDPGMTVFEDYPLLAGTPDLDINCTCHGPGLVETKIPAILIAKTPNVDKYKYIEMCNDNIFLKMTIQYYNQIQEQLAATKGSYCDLFKGNLTVLVDCNQSY